jgi:hypothetical protein
MSAVMAALLFIVARTELRTYTYLKHAFADDGRNVILDRRVGERRRSQKPPPIEKRYLERRQHDVASDLQTSGWALVRRPEIFPALSPSRTSPIPSGPS